MSIYAGNEKLHASGTNPKIQLEGTEASAKNLSIRENAGVIEIYDETAGTVVMTLENHQARHIAGGADELSGLTKAQMAADTAQWSVIIPIIAETPRTGLTADATGNKWTSINIIPQAAEIGCLKGAYIEATWTASATDSITQIEIYDTTAATSLVSVSGNAGTDVRSDAATLTAGNVINVKVNVTTASATTGATTDVTKAVLILQMGIS